MRKLASVQRIHKIEPIDGADRIELAHVLGWQCVVKKGEFKEGDLGVYFEIDSFLPVKPVFEFLRSSSYKKSELMGEGFRLKTQKMRGVLSQGLLLPMSVLENSPKYNLGDDVTEVLGVRKWEIEERATTGGTAIGELPYSIPHTDEIRVQNYPEYLEEFRGRDYYISTKMDGSSHSVSLDVNGFHITGHNYEYKDGSFVSLVKDRNYEEVVRAYAEKYNIETIAVQGELCAPGIQKNRLRLQKPEWYVFTIIVNGKRLSLHDMQSAAEEMGLIMVPIEEVGCDLPTKYPTVEALLERADGEYPNGGRKEGIVIRPVEPIKSVTIGDWLSMKVVSNKYLLKNE